MKSAICVVVDNDSDVINYYNDDTINILSVHHIDTKWLIYYRRK